MEPHTQAQAPTPIAVVMYGGPFDGATGIVAMQPSDQPVYLIRGAITRQVHAYEWADRCVEEDGIPVGWELRYLRFVGGPVQEVPSDR